MENVLFCVISYDLSVLSRSGSETYRTEIIRAELPWQIKDFVSQIEICVEYG